MLQTTFFHSEMLTLFMRRFSYPPFLLEALTFCQSSNVVAELQLAVKTIHGCIVLPNALRHNKVYEKTQNIPYFTLMRRGGSGITHGNQFLKNDSAM